MNKKISIILPSFNYADLIPEAIDSVLAQTYPHWELIIVDDGSTDNSVAVIEKYLERYPERMKLFFHENRQNNGMVGTYRLGLRYCTGDYVAFIEADDAWKPESLESKVKILRDYPDVVLVHSRVEMFGDESLVKEQRRKYSWKEFPSPETTNRPFYAFGHLMRCNFVMTFSSFMTRKEILDSVSLDFSVKHPAWFDWCLLARLSLKGKFFYIPDCHVKWRVHPENYNRQYCSQIDDFKESLQFKGEIFHLMKSFYEEENRSLKKEGKIGSDLLRGLGRSIRGEEWRRVLRFAVNGMKIAVKRNLPRAAFDKLKEGRERIRKGRLLSRVIGCLDSPAITKESLGRYYSIHGWLFLSDGTPVAGLELFYGRDVITSFEYGIRRDDVYLRYPRHNEAQTSGFMGGVFLPAELQHPLSIVLSDQKGRRYRVFEAHLQPKRLRRHRPAHRFRSATVAPTRKIVIMGLAKSATTALFFKIRNSLPKNSFPYGVRALFEPLTYDASPEKNGECVLAKIILWQGTPIFRLGQRGLRHNVCYSDFFDFGKKIMLLRDPRDRIVSHLLYSVKASSFGFHEGKLASFLELLRKKEQNPKSISFLELIKHGMVLEGWEPDMEVWAKGFQAYLDFSLRFHDEHSDFFVLKYEDFVDGRLQELENFLGFPLNAESVVDRGHERVVRTKRYGDWKNWFLPEDIDFFRPLFSAYMTRYQYGDDWLISGSPVVSPVCGSDYVRKIVSIFKEERVKSDEILAALPN